MKYSRRTSWVIQRYPREAIQASSMGELVQDIIDNKYAIGYASFGVANQNAGKVVTLKVNGVEPTKENIIDGSYIIQRPLLIVGSGIRQMFSRHSWMLSLRDRTKDCRRYGIHSNEIEKYEKGCVV